MEDEAANSEAVARGKVGLNRAIRAVEADAAECKTGGVGDFDSDPGGSSSRIRHEAFAAGFVNRGPVAVGDDDRQAFAPGSDGCGESGRSSADYEDVGHMAVTSEAVPVPSRNEERYDRN